MAFGFGLGLGMAWDMASDGLGQITLPVRCWELNYMAVHTEWDDKSLDLTTSRKRMSWLVCH